MSARTLQQIAQLIGGSIIQGEPSHPIEHLAGLEDADPTDLSFYDGSPKYRKTALASKAGALLVPQKQDFFKGPQIQTPMPYLAFMQLVRELYQEPPRAAGVHATAVVAKDAHVEASASIGPYCVVESGARVGARALLHAHVHVGRDAVVGEECVLYPHVTLWERSRLGARVLLHSGVVIGDDGFGYRRDEHGHQKVPHVGHVEIGDDVEVGANTTIDRGTFGRTVIGKGTKIDNLVQIAHNVRIGEHALIIAQVGLAGGVRVGSDSIIAGQAGIADHAVVGDATVIIPQTAVPKRAKSGEVYGGTPAMPYKDFLRASSAFRFLPALLDRVRAIEKKLGIKAAETSAKEE